MQNRMLSTDTLHRMDGQLTEAGYSLFPNKSYDRTRLKSSPLRIKEWDYYLISNDSFALALTICDNGYMGLDSISFIDFTQRSAVTKSRMNYMPMGKRGLPSSSQRGTSRAIGGQYEITFRVEDGKRQLYGHMYDFGGKNKPLLFDIVLEDVSQDSMVIVTPFDKKPHCFYYNQKINAMPAKGRLILQDTEYLFSPSSSFGILDWGRGVWPYQNTWYWGSASGMVNGSRFGMNLGYGFGDTSQATENMLFFNGTAHKLERVTFDILQEKNHPNPDIPWRVSDSQKRLELEFTPTIERCADTNYWVLRSNQRQIFGQFNGTAVLDDGKRLDIRSLTGFLEKVQNRW